MVKLGNTKAICGILGTVVDDKDDGEALETQVEFVGGSTSSRDVIREKKVAGAVLGDWITGLVRKWVDVERLVAVGGKLRWRLKVVVYVMEDDGAVEDVTVLAVVAALKDARLPTIALKEDEENIIEKEEEVEEKYEEAVAVASADRMLTLGIGGFSVAMSFVIFDGRLLIDPTKEEEGVANGKFTLVFSSGNSLQSVKKSGGVPLSDSLLEKATEQGQARATEMLQALESSTNSY